jgi:hypothetical protein
MTFERSITRDRAALHPYGAAHHHPGGDTVEAKHHSASAREYAEHASRTADAHKHPTKQPYSQAAALRSDRLLKGRTGYSGYPLCHRRRGFEVAQGWAARTGGRLPEEEPPAGTSCWLDCAARCGRWPINDPSDAQNCRPLRRAIASVSCGGLVRSERNRAEFSSPHLRLARDIAFDMHGSDRR